MSLSSNLHKSSSILPNKSAKSSKLTKKSDPRGSTDAKIIEQLRPLIRAHRVAYDKRAALIKQLTDAKSLVGDYFVVDTKSSQPTSLAERELALLTAELKTARGMVSLALGTRVLHINLFEIYNLVCDGTGLVSATATVDPAPVSEFASLKDLFDEYRVYGVSYDFTFLNGAFATAGSSKSSLCVVGYDPAELAAVSGLTGAMQLGQHKLFALPASTNTLGSTALSVGLHHFSAHVPDGVLLSNNTGGPASTSTWQATTLPSGGTYIPYGFIKVNAQVFGLLSAPSISGMLTYRCGFRCRT